MMLAGTPPFTPLPSAATLPEPTDQVADAGVAAREYLARVRGEVRERHDGGAGGLGVGAAYTDAVDRLVRFLFTSATSHFAARFPRLNQQCAVVAQGGYGRGE